MKQTAMLASAHILRKVLFFPAQWYQADDKSIPTPSRAITNNNINNNNDNDNADADADDNEGEGEGDGDNNKYSTAYQQYKYCKSCR